MNTYISLLRGINVSGKNLIKMEELRKTFENEGFSNVKTYLQTGNIIFQTQENNNIILQEKISNIIKNKFNLDVPNIVLSKEKLETIIENNPFSKEKKTDETFLYITFLGETPKKIDLKQIEEKKFPNEEIFFTDFAVYLYCPSGYGKTKLTNNFLETKLKVLATTRNWKTTNEIMNLFG